MTTHLRNTLVFLLCWHGVAEAQTTGTNAARVDGVVNCRQIFVSVNQQIENGGASTRVSYKVAECPSGSSTPTNVVVQGFLTIQNGDYQVSRNGNVHTLRTSTPHGSIDLTWRPTPENQTTYTGVWNERQGSFVTRTQEDQFFSTGTVQGTALSYPIETRPGFVSNIVKVVK